MKVKTGIDICIEDGFKNFRKAKIGLLVHPASVSSDIIPTQKLFIKHCKVTALFGPEHGIYGNLQAMIPIGNRHVCSLPIYSLYGKITATAGSRYGGTLKPTHKMLKNIDVMVIDLQDIGTRYYTFIWTMALALKACAEYKKEVVVLDRPNPINGIALEGPVLISPDFSSFVGLYPIPVRHGMTIGELAQLFNQEFKIFANLKIIKMQNWKRNMWFDDTGLPWIPPSPNMPALETALVYPGMCLLEGTNVSEGRGTTKPFEFFGAPWINPYELAEKLNVGTSRRGGTAVSLPGVVFRPLYFTPLASKFKNRLCGGVAFHITDRNKFLPFFTGVHIIKILYNSYPNEFKWANPPYEYEYKKMPFDILTGNSTIRTAIEQNSSLDNLQEKWGREVKKFNSIRKKYLLYE